MYLGANEDQITLELLRLYNEDNFIQNEAAHVFDVCVVVLFFVLFHFILLMPIFSCGETAYEDQITLELLRLYNAGQFYPKRGPPDYMYIA